VLKKIKGAAYSGTIWGGENQEKLPSRERKTSENIVGGEKGKGSSFGGSRVRNLQNEGKRSVNQRKGGKKRDRDWGVALPLSLEKRNSLLKKR